MTVNFVVPGELVVTMQLTRMWSRYVMSGSIAPLRDGLRRVEPTVAIVVSVTEGELYRRADNSYGVFIVTPDTVGWTYCWDLGPSR